MANYATLKAAIQQVVKTNGNNEITGALLQQSLLAMITSLGADYQFAGIATPETTPGTPDQNVFYLAGPGTYPNFSAGAVPDGYICAFKYNGSWAAEYALITDCGVAFGLNITTPQYGGSLLFPIKGGEKYNIENTGSTIANVSTRNTPSGETIDGPVTSNPGTTVVLTTTADAKYIRFSNTFTGRITRQSILTDLSATVSELSTKVQKNANGLTLKVAEFSFTNEKYKYQLGNMPVGATYTLKITATANVTTPRVYVRNPQDTATTQTLIVPNLTSGQSAYIELTRGENDGFLLFQTGAGVAYSANVEITLFGLDAPIEIINKQIDELNTAIRATDASIADKVPISLGKNLFDKNSPLLRDNSCFNASGNVVSNQYTFYWLISNPINVKSHRGGYIICNKSYDTTNRYCCFVDDNGNKTTVLSSVSAYQIPANASIAYILVYKQGGTVNLDDVQIEFGQSVTGYEPYSPIAGYLSGIVADSLAEICFPPSPQESRHDDYTQIDTEYIYGIFDSFVSKFPAYVTKTDLGADSSGNYRVNGYTIAFTTTPLYRIMFICNQHGGSANGDPVMGAYIATQFIKDICGSGHRHNDLLRWIRENVVIDIIPAANPWGIDNKRRVNYNGVNLNRNWPTSGWASFPSGAGTDDYKGAAAADQPELQCYLAFITQCAPDIIIDNHTLGGTDGTHDANSGYMIMGFVRDYLAAATTGYNTYFAKINTILQKEYGITLARTYHVDGTDTDPDCRVWTYENGYYGGLIEMQWRDPLESDAGFTGSIIEASYMLAITLYQYYYQFLKS